MSDFSDPTGCQAAAGWQKLDYVADQADAQRRLKRGQVQSLCSVCQRWRWGDRQCKNFVKFPSQKEVVQVILEKTSEGVGFADISKLTGYTRERIRQLYKKHNKTGKGIRQIQSELKAKNNKESKKW